MLHVRTSQLIIAGDGCGIQGDFFHRCMAMEIIRARILKDSKNPFRELLN